MNLTVRRDHAALRGVGEMTAAKRMHRDNAIEDITRYKGSKGAAIHVCDLLHRGQHLLRQLPVFTGIVPFDIQLSSFQADAAISVVAPNGEEVGHACRIAGAGSGGLGQEP